MTATRPAAVIPPFTPKRETQPIDIYAQWDADRKARDWGKVMIEADKRAPLGRGRQ